MMEDVTDFKYTGTDTCAVSRWDVKSNEGMHGTDGTVAGKSCRVVKWVKCGMNVMRMTL